MTKRENRVTFASTQWTTEKADQRRAKLKQITALMLSLMTLMNKIQRTSKIVSQVLMIKMAKKTRSMMIRQINEEEDYKMEMRI